MVTAVNPIIFNNCYKSFMKLCSLRVFVIIQRQFPSVTDDSMKNFFVLTYVNEPKSQFKLFDLCLTKLCPMAGSSYTLCLLFRENYIFDRVNFSWLCLYSCTRNFTLTELTSNNIASIHWINWPSQFLLTWLVFYPYIFIKYPTLWHSQTH